MSEIAQIEEKQNEHPQKSLFIHQKQTLSSLVGLIISAIILLIVLTTQYTESLSSVICQLSYNFSQNYQKGLSLIKKVVNALSIVSLILFSIQFALLCFGLFIRDKKEIVRKYMNAIILVSSLLILAIGCLFGKELKVVLAYTEFEKCQTTNQGLKQFVSTSKNITILSGICLMLSLIILIMISYRSIKLKPVDEKRKPTEKSLRKKQREGFIEVNEIETYSIKGKSLKEVDKASQNSSSKKSGGKRLNLINVDEKINETISNLKVGEENTSRSRIQPISIVFEGSNIQRTPKADRNAYEELVNSSSGEIRSDLSNKNNKNATKNIDKSQIEIMIEYRQGSSSNSKQIENDNQLKQIKSLKESEIEKRQKKISASEKQSQRIEKQKNTPEKQKQKIEKQKIEKQKKITQGDPIQPLSGRSSERSSGKSSSRKKIFLNLKIEGSLTQK